MTATEKLAQMKAISRQLDHLAYTFVGTMIGLIEIQESPSPRAYADFLKNCIERKTDYKKAHAELTVKFNSVSGTDIPV